MKNGATGRSDIEGKAVRVTASDSGSERVSIKNQHLSLTGEPLGKGESAFRWFGKQSSEKVQDSH